MRALVVALAASLVVAAPASAATFFKTPSGNIGCVISKSVARCDISEKAWTPPPKPASCPVDWGNGLVVSRRGSARFTCAGDTVLGGQRVLGYGDDISRGRFRCVSRRNGVRCVNTRNEHGFKLSRHVARWF
ncbi:MAG: hypothetical protein QOH58_2649 [Thermoleophilaceae bacterium]|jgi:hypothetical protein|nr:hypothetical protein [Thermoleophilaceae bacterium]